VASLASRLPSPVPPPGTRLALRFPVQGGHNGDESPLIAGPDAIDRRAPHRPRLALDMERRFDFEFERADEHLEQADAGFAGQIPANHRLPGIAFIASGLLGYDMLLLEFPIRPPSAAGAIEVHRLGKELVAVLGGAIDVDRFKRLASGFFFVMRSALLTASLSLFIGFMAQRSAGGDGFGLRTSLLQIGRRVVRNRACVIGIVVCAHAASPSFDFSKAAMARVSASTRSCR
jgi:hypothetical protein